VECSSTVFLDCANGVGALPSRFLAPHLAALGLQLSLINAPDHFDATSLPDPASRAVSGEGQESAGRLNHLCGSDFVQVGQQWPQGLTAETACDALCASLDGDADRIVFYFSASDSAPRNSGTSVSGGSKAKLPPEAESRTLVLLDGDYIAALVATYVMEVAKVLPIQEEVSVGMLRDVSL
jgi:phosphoacetylglucosamine mutase